MNLPETLVGGKWENDPATTPSWLGGNSDPSATKPAQAPETAPSAPLSGFSQPSAGGDSVDPKAFQTAINQMRTKMESNNKLINAKNAVFKHMYDQPLTDEEKGALTPSLAHAISTGNRSLIDAAISDVTNQIKGYNSTIDTNLAAYSNAVSQANSLKQDVAKSAMTYIQNGVPADQVMGFMTNMGLSESDAASMLPSGSVAMRTDRNNNPTAMTTDVAKSGGLIEGIDYIQGDPFTTASGQTLYTAKLLGDPIQITIKAIDNMGFTTESGQPRWSYINMSQEQWMSLAPEQKANVVKEMYKHEGGNGTAIGQAPAASGTAMPSPIDPNDPNYSIQPIQAYGGLTQAGLDQAAQYYATTGSMPALGLGSSAQTQAKRNMIINRAAQLGGGDIAAAKAMYSANTKALGQQVPYYDTVERSLNTAEQGLAQLTQTFTDEGINPNDSTVANMTVNEITKNFGDSSKIRAFQAGLQEVSNEYQQVFSRGGTQGVTESVRQRANDIFNGNITVSDFQAISQELQQQGGIVKQQAQNTIFNIQGNMGASVPGSSGIDSQVSDYLQTLQGGTSTANAPSAVSSGSVWDKIGGYLSNLFG